MDTALEERKLMDRLSELAGVVSAATAETVEVVADAIERRIWEGWGINSPEHWVALRCGVSSAHARRLVGAARGLRDLPEIRKAFAAGELTEDHVAVIVRAKVTSFHDGEVVQLARNATVSQLARGLSFLPRIEVEPSVDKPAPIEPEPAEQTRVSFGAGDDGMWGLQARLRPEDGAVVEQAMVAARDSVFRDRHPNVAAGEVASDVSWTDALIRLAHVALDGFDRGADEGRSPGHRFQVLIHWDPTTGATAGTGPEPVDDAVRRQMACDAIIRPWFATPGQPVAMGRRARVVDAKLRTVVEHRDRGCVVPGCGRFRWLLIHHLVHWEDGGPTDPENLVALCGEHHRMVHRDELIITGNPELGSLHVTDGQGRPVGPSPPSPPGASPADAARRLGLPDPKYQQRRGDRPQWKWMDWSAPKQFNQPTHRTGPTPGHQSMN